ncbi:MAG: DUF3343 domain-containing protein [Oscillospiraceae bacterium]
MDAFCLAAFLNGNTAAAAQRTLREGGLPAVMMPTPRGLTRACGLSLRFSPQNAAAIRNALRLLPAEACRFYRASEANGQRVFSPLGEQSPDSGAVLRRRTADTPTVSNSQTDSKRSKTADVY